MDITVAVEALISSTAAIIFSKLSAFLPELSLQTPKPNIASII